MTDSDRAKAELSRRSAATAANFHELSARIDSELADATAVKSSLEGRTLGIFALNLGVVTLYLALSEQLKVTVPGPESFYFWALCTGFAAAGLSLVAGIWAAWPAVYSRIPVSLLDDAYINAKEVDTILLPDLVPERITSLERLRKVNGRKAVLVIVSLGLSLVSILGFATSVVGPVLNL
ncbi:hypothetical protein [Microbacterium sp. A1-JK]|uniref:hypothetical protein n=1 Tax=Microbacterium sp. A1-JK TaxID=3177516 RepID=UPI00388470BC